MKKTIFLLFVTFTISSYKAQNCKEMNTTDTTVLNLKNLYREILKDSIKFPEIVFRQAIAETGWLKSTACLKRNNLFGFNNGVSKFKSWQDAVHAYKKWQVKNYKGGPYESFLIKIKYAADTRAYVKFLYKLKIPDCIYN